jgi:hypothetical protein
MLCPDVVKTMWEKHKKCIVPLLNILKFTSCTDHDDSLESQGKQQMPLLILQLIANAKLRLPHQRKMW